MKKIIFNSTTSGLITFNNDIKEIYVPNYDVNDAAELSLKILNLKNNKNGKKLKDSCNID